MASYRRFRLAAAAVALALTAVASGPASAALPDRVGFNVQSVTEPFTPAEIDRQLDAVKRLRGTVVRVAVPWAQVEGARDVPRGSSQGYNEEILGRLDALIRGDKSAGLRGASDRGIRVLAMVVGTPTWASSCPRLLGICLDPGNSWRYGPVDVREYGEFVRFLTERFGRKLAGIEVWNEPNWGDSALMGSVATARASYAGMVRSAYAQRTHRVPIYAGGLHKGHPANPLFDRARVGITWMRAIYPSIRGHFDVWSVHDYGKTPRFTTAQRRELISHGDRRVPVSVDEFGSQATVADLLSLTRQGPRIKRFLRALGRRNYVREAIQFELRDSQGTAAWQLGWGLLRRDYTRKPAFNIVRRLLALR